MTPFPRQFLVHLDPTAATRARLRVARQLADRLGATLSTLYAAAPLLVALPASTAITGTAEALFQIDEERLARTRRLFDEVMRGPGASASWSALRDMQVSPSFAQQALFADLLILGQPDPSDENANAVPPGFAQQVVIESGRPALVVPYIQREGAVGQVVAIAWKPSREAARAVTAALPLLQRADQVHVFSWDCAPAPVVSGTALDLEGYLAVHGVRAQWHRGGPEPERLGEMLLSRVADAGADLLVMGCYGHSRAREWALGGVSRTILGSMTVAVLMAH